MNYLFILDDMYGMNRKCKQQKLGKNGKYIYIFIKLYIDFCLPCHFLHKISSSWGEFTNSLSLGREGGVPGGIHAAPFSPAQMQSASASRRILSKSIWPLSSLMNLRSVSKSMSSPIIFLRYLLKIATHM